MTILFFPIDKKKKCKLANMKELMCGVEFEYETHAKI